MSDLENVGQDHDVQQSLWRRLMAAPTSYLMSIVMFTISLTVYEIFAKHEKCKKLLENECQGQKVEERDLRHSTGSVRIHIGDFFQNFSYLGAYIYA